MTKKDDWIARIIDIEWNMFQDVPNMGGKALCQEDPKTFEINRVSQFMGWSEAALESYLGDLTEAGKNGRNLLTEKYARMMELISPLEYASMEHLIPPLDPEVPPLKLYLSGKRRLPASIHTSLEGRGHFIAQTIHGL